MAPNDPLTLYVGNVLGINGSRGVYRTNDGANTWSLVTPSNGSINVGWLTQWDFDVTFVAVAPATAGAVYFGSSAMLGKSTDGGTTWHQIYTSEVTPGYWRGNGLETTEISDIAVNPSNPNWLLCGFIDTGVLLSRDAGQSFHRVFKPDYPYGDDVFSVTFDPDVPGTVYLTDGELMITGTYGNVLRSTNAGLNWSILSTRTPYAGLPYGRYYAFAIDRSSPTQARTLYTACIREATESPIGGVFKSLDGGITWASASAGLGDQNEHVTSIAIDPFNNQRLYASVPVWWYHGSGGFFKSDNGGATWRRTAPNLQSVWKVIADPRIPGVVYAGTSSEFAGGARGGVPGNHGVYRSRNAGATWEAANTGLTTLATLSLTIDPVIPGRVFLGTEGNGIFVSNNATTGTGDSPTPALSVATLQANYPNPFNPVTTIAYSLRAPQSIRLAVYDVRGRLVTLLVHGWRESGNHVAVWDGRDTRGRAVASGDYICRLDAGPFSQTRKLSLIR